MVQTTTERKEKGTEKQVHDLTKKENVSNVIDQSLRSLHEMERRLVAMEAEFARITGRAPSAPHTSGLASEAGRTSSPNAMMPWMPGAQSASPSQSPFAGMGAGGSAGPFQFPQAPFPLVGQLATPWAHAAAPAGHPGLLPFAGSPLASSPFAPSAFAPSPFAPFGASASRMSGHAPVSIGSPDASQAGMGSQAIQGMGGEASSLLGGAMGAMGEGMTRTRDLADMPPQVRQPSMDVLDEGKEFIIHVDLPGVKKEDLDIMVTERALVLNAKVRPESDLGVVVHSERPPVIYRRNVMLGSEVDTTNAKANLKDGILTVRIPKQAPGNGPRQLDVAYG